MRATYVQADTGQHVWLGDTQRSLNSQAHRQIRRQRLILHSPLQLQTGRNTLITGARGRQNRPAVRINNASPWPICDVANATKIITSWSWWTLNPKHSISSTAGRSNNISLYVSLKFGLMKIINCLLKLYRVLKKMSENNQFLLLLLVLTIF